MKSSAVFSAILCLMVFTSVNARRYSMRSLVTKPMANSGACERELAFIDFNKYRWLDINLNNGDVSEMKFEMGPDGKRTGNTVVLSVMRNYFKERGHALTNKLAQLKENRVKIVYKGIEYRWKTRCRGGKSFYTGSMTNVPTRLLRSTRRRRRSLRRELKTLKKKRTLLKIRELLLELEDEYKR